MSEAPRGREARAANATEVRQPITVAPSQAAMDDCSSTNGATAQQAIQTTHPQGLSKKAQKRAAKAARLHELKLERRAREREAKKRKRQERAKAVDNDAFEASSTFKRRRTNPFGNGSRFQARLVVDLGFDELMTDKVCPSFLTCAPACGDGPAVGNKFPYFTTGVQLQC